MSMDNKYQELLHKNRQLQKQLAQAHLLIQSLRSENGQLKERLTQYQNQQSTVEVISQGSEDEVFTQSSNESSQEFHHQFHQLNEEAEEIPLRSNVSANETPHIPILTPLSSAKTIDFTPTKVIFNYQSEGSHVPKVLTKQPRKQAPRPVRQNIEQKAKWASINSIQYSAIKTQQPIIMKNTNGSSLFHRVKSSKKIYDTFFVTGYSFQINSPIIEYCFPSESKHFAAILSLIYTENSLRPFENLSSGARSPRLANIKTGKLSIKDNFVMIICKGQNGQKQYLFACQVDDLLEGPDNNLYVFNRLFCFITSCNFFSEYMKIIEQFINKINSTKFDFKILSPLLQRGTKDQLRSQLQEHLRILWQKNVEQNQFANFGLGNQINIFIDVPPASENYKNLLHYRPWGILFCPIHLSNEAQQLKQKELFGFLLVYMLTQTKVMLYSMVKSKVSEAMLHALEMIKPLEYVNPIIMGTLKDEHQQYFDAPMSVIMGLWGEQKPKRKQKIEIFMNRKPSLNGISGILQQNRVSAVDGVVFNLDTGMTFGGGLTAQKNRMAIQLNNLIQNNCKSTKQQYKLFQNLVRGKNQLEHPQTRQLGQKIVRMISGTQLYSVYKDKSNSMMMRL